VFSLDLRIALRIYGLVYRFRMFYGFLGTRKAIMRNPRGSSRSQGTTTKPGGDVCGRVKWLAPEKSPDLAHAEHILAVRARFGQ
jgi:hypothetical protein